MSTLIQNALSSLMTPAQRSKLTANSSSVSSSAPIGSDGVNSSGIGHSVIVAEAPKYDYFGKFLEGLQTSMQANATSAIQAEKDAAAAANDFTYKLFKEGNLFAADQAEKAFLREQSSADKAMDFEKSERLASQDFYERLSNTSYQRAVEDLKAAGLNPALAYAQGGSSAAMSSGASGSTASSGAPGSMSGSSAKANAASAKNADIRLMSGVIDGLVSVANNTLSSAVKLFSVFT